MDPNIGAKTDPRSRQDGSKIVLGRLFVCLGCSLRFLIIWGSVLVLFGDQKWSPGGRIDFGKSGPWMMMGVQDDLGIVLVRSFFCVAVRVVPF